MNKIVKGVLVPVPAPDFEQLFAPGTRHTLPRGDVATVRLRQGTSLWLPSGRVVAGEMLVLDDADGGFVQRVPPGQYPLVLVIAMFAKRSYLPAHETIAAARLVIRDEPIVSWEMAVCEGQDVSELGDDELFGYPVDGGTGGFIDATTIATLCENHESHHDYHDRLMTALDGAESDETTPATLTDDEGRPLVVAFPSGNGDGHYPTWVGRTADGEVACFLTDFLILTDDEDNGDDEPPSGNTAGHALSDVAQGHEMRAGQTPAMRDATVARPLSPGVTSPARRTTVARPLSAAQHLTSAHTPARRVVQKSPVKPAIPTDEADA